MRFWNRLAVVFSLCLAPVSAVHATAIYAATAAGGPGQLYIIDSANGSVISNIGALNDAAGQNYPITGLAFHPITGVLYGSTGNNPAGTAARLVTINPTTALVTVIGSFNAGPVSSAGTPSTMGDLAFDTAGNLFGVGTIGGPQLYSINPATAQATVIGSTGLTSTTGGGIEISASSVIYGTPTASRYGTYNGVTGAYTNITNPIKPVGGAYGALSFDPATGVLYGMNVGSGLPVPTHLVSIDPATGAVTDLGASVDALDAIAVVLPEPAAISAFLLAPTLCTRRRR